MKGDIATPPIAIYSDPSEDASSENNPLPSTFDPKLSIISDLTLPIFSTLATFEAAGLEDLDTTGECSICLENADTSAETENLVRIKRCGHILGRTCLLAWLGTNNRCPMGRCELLSRPWDTTPPASEHAPHRQLVSPPGAPALEFNCLHTCGWTFATRAALRNHARGLSDHFLCEKCAIVFEDSETLDVHGARDRRNHPQHCPLEQCDFESKAHNGDVLLGHLLANHKGVTLTCHPCARDFPVGSAGVTSYVKHLYALGDDRCVGLGPATSRAVRTSRHALRSFTPSELNRYRR